MKLAASFVALALASAALGAAADGFFSANPIGRGDPPGIDTLCRVVIEYAKSDPHTVTVRGGGTNPIARCDSKADAIAIASATLRFLEGN